MDPRVGREAARGGTEVTIIEALTIVANLRGTTEHRIANDYTNRQITHIVGTYVKDKFMVVAEIAEILSAVVGKKSVKKRSRGGTAASSTRRRVPDWYKPRRRNGVELVQNIVDLDGPIEALEPFIGRGAVKKWHYRKE